MLVFSTRLPLKPEITQEECLDMFISWVTESDHYPINEVDYDVSSHKDFDYTVEHVTVSIRHYKSEGVELSACRLENKEEIAIWVNDCIFLNEEGTKSLLIQLNCNSIDFDTELPRINKPYIVRKFVEAGYCKDDAGIPVLDKPIAVDENYYDICAAIIRGEYDYAMPVVYVSCNRMDRLEISPDYLARQLSGVAHVFYETKHEIALKLRDDTDGQNAYAGFVGVYFPRANYCQKYGRDYYFSKRHMSAEIIGDIWNALKNTLDSSTYNWNQILALQAKQKMSEWKDISERNKQQLSEYMDTFDEENSRLRQQIDELNQELNLLRAKVETYKASFSTRNREDCFYRVGDEPELYPSERNDLLYSILSQVQYNYSEGSRPYKIIQSLLEANPKVGECDRVVSEVKKIFGRGDGLSPSNEARLKELGFTITSDKKHIKIIFHDASCMFTVSKSGSDHRDGKNLASDICKMIDVGKKF